MKSFLCGLAVLVGVATFFPANISAQDYRVYTRVSHQGANTAPEKPIVVARSLTIWHAGKVYDYMDSVGELVVYDPHQQRFTVISGPHNMACTVEFSELKQYIKVARTRAKEYLAELGETNTPAAAKQAELIAFQLDPKFHVKFSPNENQLTCSSSQITYEINTIRAPNPEVAEAFRQYTDWASRLNFVLHGRSLMPTPRLQVNEQLVQRQLISEKVTLTLADSSNTKLSAEHSINWELAKHDRSRIAEWKQLLRDGQLKFVSFKEYQRKLLAKKNNQE